MRYLGLALYAEGKTDYYFLSPLLLRLCETLCLRDATEPIEIGPILALDDREENRYLSREERIEAAATEARNAWNILFVHTDGAGDPDQAKAERVAPALMKLKNLAGITGIGVTVVPVRETETWAIIDGDALRKVLGTTLSDQAMGLPRTAREAEKIIDPKARLCQVFKATQPTGRRKSLGTSPYLGAIGEQVALDKLRAATSFATLEAELTNALRYLAILN